MSFDSFDHDQAYSDSPIKDIISLDECRKMSAAEMAQIPKASDYEASRSRQAFQNAEKCTLQIYQEIINDFQTDNPSAELMSKRLREAKNAMAISKIYFRRKQQNPPPIKTLLWDITAGPKDSTGKKSKEPTGMNVEQLGISREAAPDTGFEQQLKFLLREAWSFTATLDQVAAIGEPQLIHAYFQMQALKDELQTLKEAPRGSVERKLFIRLWRTGMAKDKADVRTRQMAPSRRPKHHAQTGFEEIGRRDGIPADTVRKQWSRFCEKVKSRANELFLQYQLTAA